MHPIEKKDINEILYLYAPCVKLYDIKTNILRE